MEHARPPPELLLEGSPATRAETWQRWWRQFSVFLRASGVNKEPNDVQASLLVNLIGPEGYEIFSTFTFTKEENVDNLDCLKKKFDSHFGTKPNITMLRFKFFTRNQQTGEMVSQYVTALKLLSQGCEFEHLTDGLIRDRVVCGISDNIVRDRMLRTEDLTLAKAVQICEAAEMSKEESRQLNEAASSIQIDLVNRRGSGHHQGADGCKNQDKMHRKNSWKGTTAQRRPVSQESCVNCGSERCDNGPRCPALKAKCFVCDRRGHYARMCSRKSMGKRVHHLNIIEPTGSDSDDSKLYVNVVQSNCENTSKEWFEYLQINEKLKLVREHTAKDNETKLLMEYILQGWPNSRRQVESTIRLYWPYREYLQCVEGIILKNNLVFIPSSIRSEMLGRIHEGHLGIEKCKMRARDVMFWPGMSRDIERTVRGCATCALHAARPPREPLIPHQIPEVPWFKLGSDIFEFKKKYYLIIVDYFSNFVEVNELNNISSNCVIKAMKEQFGRHGIPNELVTDNGPAYSSREFKNFVHSWEIIHITSSPLYPQSNGKSERSIRTVKNLLKKCLDSGQDYNLSLLNYRTTPREKIDSPAQILMGRRLNTRLPVCDKLLKEKTNNKMNYEKIIKQTYKQKKYYDKSARDLPALQDNDKVVVVDGYQRKIMKVLNKSKEPRSYLLQDEVGRKYRRNRRHMLGYKRSNVTPSISEECVCGKPGVSESCESGNNVDSPKIIQEGPITRSKSKLLAKK